MFVELIVNTITDGVVDSCTQQELNVVGRTDPSSVCFSSGLQGNVSRYSMKSAALEQQPDWFQVGPKETLAPTVSKPDPLKVPPRLHVSPKKSLVPTISKPGWR